MSRRGHGDEWRYDRLLQEDEELYERLLHNPDQVCSAPVPVILEDVVRQVANGWQLDERQQRWLLQHRVL